MDTIPAHLLPPAHRSPVSSSGKAIFEDEMGPNPVSSSGKAVYEDEMGLNAVSSSGKAVYEDEMGTAKGSAGVPHPHSGLDPESPPCHFARAKRVVTSARRSAKQPHSNACSVRCAHGCGAPSADIGLWRT